MVSRVLMRLIDMKVNVNPNRIIITCVEMK